MEDWHDVMAPQIEKIMARPGCRTIVAFNPKESDKRIDLHGWICFERDYQVMVRVRSKEGRYVEQPENTDDPLVHYVFVKQPYRRPMGIARQLFVAADIDPMAPFNHTCRTSVVSKLSHVIPKARWQPLIARFTKRNPTTQRGQNAETSTSEDHQIQAAD